MNPTAFEFASPGSFGDWANYAGFNRKTGEIEESRFSQGVKPPESFSELIDQKTAGISKPLQAVAPAMSQFGQGNVIQGINTLRGVPPKQPNAATAASGATAAPAVVDPNVHDYLHGLD